ncbi:hypothetical protein VaNZ11_005137 [Volvox africanus]|uniref:NFACT RNA-binding domain-containing protein n=1 Tax=Volvox africanus TaxID=51714 RepID=A0ABQ5RY99_9CHLO|nr:hypothetical protein VaNZ11_005137 [Volvox africanus]
MVKQRMSSADVAAEVACLRQRILGLRVANIYDLTPKTYVIKLARSGEEGEKVYLLLESGSRFHTTKVLREKSSELPSNFTLKLRKHCRTRRVESVRQLGVDRCMELTLGSGPAAVHLILEMYSQGNIVLTDAKYEVLTLLRSHRDDAKGLVIMARYPYPMAAMRLASRVTGQQLDAAAPGAANYKALVAAVLPYGPTIAEHVVMDAGLDPNVAVPLEDVSTADAPVPNDNRNADPAVIIAATDGADNATAISGVGLGAGGEEDGEEAGVAGGTGAAAADGGGGGGEGTSAAPAPRSGVLPSDVRRVLLAALGRLDDWFAQLEAGKVPSGFITLTPPGSSAKAGKKKAKGGKDTAVPATPSVAAAASAPLDPAAAAAAVAAGELVFAEFYPLPLLPYSGQPCLELPTFDDALDEFYSKVEGQRADIARADAERAALSRLDKIKQDQGSRAEALLHQAEECDLKAQLITYNLDAVDAALVAVNQSLATGMDWSALAGLIREERRAGNPVAGLIASLELDNNSVTLLLANTLDDMGEDGDEAAMTRKAVKVSVDLSLSAHSNASAYFDARRRHLVKHTKTVAANQAALAAAEKKAEAQLKQVRSAPPALQPVRKPMWFERFHWFVSSENYLVVSGRDAQQNELLVKRYFRKGDVYVHAELHGASSTIIKNLAPDQPVPPLTLQQAGCACVCRSRAWDSKIVTSAWWVHHHQVSKTAPTGEYLTTGSFMIRGKKNFLPPQPLVMGFAFLFKLDDSSIPAHRGERAVRVLDPDAASVAGGGPSRSAIGGSAAAAAAAGSDEDIDEEGREILDRDEEENEEAAGAAEASPPGGGGEGGSGGGGLTQDALVSSSSRRQPGIAATALVAPSPLDRFLEGSYDVPYGSTAPAAMAAAAFERYGLSHGGDVGDDNGEAAGQDGQATANGSGRGGGGTGAGGGRRHLSAKERALLKKQGTGGAGSTTAGARGTREDEEYTIVASDSPALPAGTGSGTAKGKAGGGGATAGKAPGAGPGAGVGHVKALPGTAEAPAGSSSKAGQRQPPPPPAPPSAQRGKKGKLAKVKDKYADQDAEERALALAVLGSAGEKKSRTDRRKERKERREAVRQEGRTALLGDEDERRQAIERATGKQFVKPEGGADDDVDVDDNDDGEVRVVEMEEEEGEEAAAGGEQADGVGAGNGVGEDGEEQAEEGPRADGATEAERAEIAALLAEENVEVPLADEDAARLSVLDSLTGLPRPEDLLLYAVPVCGPYNAIQSYKFKVKVTPGTVKKGKAARQAIELLIRGLDVAPRERDVMKAVPEMEAINALVGPGVKLSMPGLQKLKADDKKTKKARAQARVAGQAQGQGQGQAEDAT